MLSDVQLKLRYRSSEDNLLSDLYLPCLYEATSYRRAVGFFSSYALSDAAAGLPGFIRRGGTMQLVASPELSPDDIEAINKGYRDRAAVIEERLTETLSAEPLPSPVRDRLGFLAWLVAEGRLNIRIALVSGAGRVGIYHEKVGIFRDEGGNEVAFQGSANESHGGLVANFESVLVFRSWAGGETNVVDVLRRDFEDLWKNETSNLEVFDFPEAAEKALLRFRPVTVPVRDPLEDPPSGDSEQPPVPKEPALPPARELRGYQRDAMAAWFRANGRGMLQMATGTGKTVTALAIVAKLFDAFRKTDKALFVVVLCPYQHLVSQWAEEARDFGVDPVLCFKGHDYWRASLRESLDAVRRGYSNFGMAIATNATFATDPFQKVLEDVPSQSLLIADEVHNLGAVRLREALPEHVDYRLGLSATPERWYDEEGTEALGAYFGDVVFELGLEDAINIGALAPYDYHPQIVYLDGEELDEYLELTEKIGRLMSWGSGGTGSSAGSPALDALLVRRARIVASARGKLPALLKVAQPFSKTTHNLFYCGDGTVESATSSDEIRQLDAVVRVLGRDLGMAVNSYTAENFLDERDELRDRFATGDLQGLVAIRCLDEGVDIPETRRAFILASSTNPKQFIQRRGRILRLSPGKQFAEIFDFLVFPPPDSVDPELFKVERSLAQRELERVALFARLARNGPQALESLEEVRRRYDLLHVA